MMKILNLVLISFLYGIPYDGITLITDMGQVGQGNGGSQQFETQLIDNQLNVINSWFYDTGPASIAYLTPDSILFLPCKVTNQNQGAGPNGGRFKKIDWDGNVIWDYVMPEEICKPHHDIAVLPNGNILVICSEEKTQQEALNAGIENINGPMRLDMILEIEPVGLNDMNILWEWHYWDHLVQDINMNLDNYGQINENPHLLDINVSQSGNGGENGIADWNHCNAISYNPILDQIVLSSRHMDEFYVIDHSTTTEEASGHTSGFYGRGGDFLYRWGNPQNYHRGNASNQILNSPHGINWIPIGFPGEGNFIIFNNDHSNNSSAVLEIIPPINTDGIYQIDAVNPFGPSSYSWIHQSNFYSDKQSGAFRLPNGNTIITSTLDESIFEVNETNDIEWTYSGELRTARAIKYSHNYLDTALNGDLNDDDSIDVLDVITLVNHILSPTNVELDGADINNDGEVNILDVVALVNIILGS